MLQSFSAYIKIIAVFIIFSAFAQGLLPDNNFKKYIKLVFSLLMLATIINPVYKLLLSDNRDILDLINEKTEVLAAYNTNVTYEDTLKQDIFTGELENDIKNRIEAMGYGVLDVKAETTDEGEVLSISLSLTEGETSDKVKNVSPVEGFHSQNDTNEAAKVKDELCNIYGVKEENIFIVL